MTRSRLPPWLAAAGVALAFAGAARSQAPAATQKPPARIDLLGHPVTFFREDGLRAVFDVIWRRPVLVVSWRADDAATLDRVVPAMLALQQHDGDDLVVLFVERSSLALPDVLRLAARRHWLCGPACWTCDVPPGTELLGTPSFALTSNEQIVLSGDPIADAALLDAAVARLVEERRSGPADAPPDLRAALQALHDGQLAKAVGLVAADAGHARTIADDISMQVQCTNELLLVGNATEARARLELLVKELAPLPAGDPLRLAAKSGLETFDCGTFNDELKASAALQKLQDQLCAKGPGDALAQAFRALAKSREKTHSAERALELAKIAAP